MPITMTLSTPAVRKLIKLLSDVPESNSDLFDTREQFIWEISQLPTPAPWRKVVSHETGVAAFYEKLECGHSYRLKGYDYPEDHAKKRRCKDC